MSEIDKLRPVLVVFGQIPDLHLVDERVLTLFPHPGLRPRRFVWTNEVLGKRAVDHTKAGVNRHWIVGRAVLAKQILEDIDRYCGANLDLTHEILANDLTGKYLGDLGIEYGCGGVHLQNPAIDTGSSHAASRRSVSASRRATVTCLTCSSIFNMSVTAFGRMLRRWSSAHASSTNPVASWKP